MIFKTITLVITVTLVALFIATGGKSTADDAPTQSPLSVVIYANAYPDARVAIQRILEKAEIGPVQTSALLSCLQASALTRVKVVILYCDNELPAQTIADLEVFVKAGGGLVVLHHTAYSASFSKELESLIGGSFAGALQGGEKMGPYTIQIEDPTHPITRGVQEFQLPYEERYIQMTLKEDILLLFSSDRIAQKNFGWTRTEGAGRVFFFQPCHYLPTWETPGLGQILVNGVRWAGTQTRGRP